MTSTLLVIHIVCAVATIVYGVYLSFRILSKRAERNEQKSAVFVAASLVTILLGVALGLMAGQETIALCSNIIFYTALLTVMHGISLGWQKERVFVIPGFSAAMLCLIVLL